MHFNSKELPKPTNEYVCWIDMMGTKNMMMDSLEIASNFIFKFHSVIQATHSKDVNYYPLMDGVFVTTPSLRMLKGVVYQTFKELSNNFLNEDAYRHQFIIRGAIAFGPVIHGSSVTEKACKDFKNQQYKSSLLIGTPMTQAYLSEHLAPPFGLYVHESARAFSAPNSGRFSGKYYHWLDRQDDSQLRDSLNSNLIEYFKWCSAFSHTLEMDEAKVHVYMRRVEEYFSDLKQKRSLCYDNIMSGLVNNKDG